MHTSLDYIRYHTSLVDLERAAQDFAVAILRAAEASKSIEEVDEATVTKTLDKCRTALFSAFSQAPGMIQIFTGDNK
jgi:hypothetical protein